MDWKVGWVVLLVAVACGDDNAGERTPDAGGHTPDGGEQGRQDAAMDASGPVAEDGGARSDASDVDAGSRGCEGPAVVEELGDNEGAWLDSYSVTGDGLDAWSSFSETGPGIRNFCRKWVYASGRGKAYYAGANHCAPHRFNDLWEYDLESNTWEMLYEPDFNDCIREWEERKATWDEHCIVRNEVLQTESGGMCNPGHTWWGVTYDETLDRVVWMSHWGGAEERYIEEKGLSDQVVNDDLPPLWSFDPDTQKWSLIKTPTPVPGGSSGGSLMYVPSREKMVWYAAQWNGDGMWALDSNEESWEQWLTVSDTYHDPDEASPKGTNYLVNYDSKHDVLVGFGEDGRVYSYDFEERDWSVRGSMPTEEIGTGVAALAYDRQNGVHLLSNSEGMFVYDYEREQGERIEPAGGMPGEITGGTHMSYYDERCNVFVFYFGSATDRHWVYRYRQTP
jgi:hypothetical protein